MSSSPASAVQIPATPKLPPISLLPYQKADVEAKDRFRWNCWSRQTGKSFTKSLRRILRGIDRGRDQIFLSASERQSRELMMKAQQHVQAMGIAARSTTSTYFEGSSLRQMEIVLPKGIRIIGLPANPRTARGFTGDVFLDEFAMHAEDREIWASMLPSIMRGDGELDVASTPKGKQNKFYQLASNLSFVHQTVTIYDAVKDGLEVDIEALRASMADDEMFRQEFGCEFVDEATSFLTFDMIAACEDPQLDGEPDWTGLGTSHADLYAGVDIGRKHDLTVIWLLERDGERLITCGVIELAKTPFRKQYDVLCEVLRLHNLRRCCIDSTGLGMQMAESAVEDFGAHQVEAWTFTTSVKQQLAGGLRIRMEEKSLVIPVDDKIRNDFHSITKLVTAAGGIRYLAERTADGHADRFWAAALAVQAAGVPTGKAEAMGGGKLRHARQRGAL